MEHQIVPNSCRICLRKVKNLHSIYNPLEDCGKTPSEMLQKLAGIILEEVSENPELPKKICKICTQSLTEAFQFRAKALKSQEIIQSYSINLLKDGGTMTNTNCVLQVKQEEIEYVELPNSFNETQQEDIGLRTCDNVAMKSEEPVEDFVVLDFNVEEDESDTERFTARIIRSPRRKTQARNKSYIYPLSDKQKQRKPHSDQSSDEDDTTENFNEFTCDIAHKLVQRNNKSINLLHVKVDDCAEKLNTILSLLQCRQLSNLETPSPTLAPTTKEIIEFSRVSNEAECLLFNENLKNIKYRGKWFEHLLPFIKIKRHDNDAVMGTNCGFILLDKLFTRTFLTLVSWTGFSRRGFKKIAFKDLENIQNLMLDLIRTKDPSYSINQLKDFVSNQLRNSTSRAKPRTCFIRKSATKIRSKRKKIDINGEINDEHKKRPKI